MSGRQSEKRAENTRLRETLDRLSAAALVRDTVMGDLSSLLQAKEELWSATKQAQAVLMTAKVEV